MASSSSSSLDRLPQDIVADILLRLPAKTLLDLRRICKSGSSLVLAPSFAAKHSLAPNLTRTSSSSTCLVPSTTGPSLPTTQTSALSYAPTLSRAPTPSAQSSPSPSMSTHSPSRS
ncbi:hypothetical protein NL676_001376 [Syzygium grande]|nr:hypothetical protein NL676_001376 [Syzygium grande]